MSQWLIRPIAIASEMVVHVPEIERLDLVIGRVAEGWTPPEVRPATARRPVDGESVGSASALYDAIADTVVPRNPAYHKSYRMRLRRTGGAQ